MKRLAAGFIAILISALPAGVARAGCAPSVDARIDVRIAAEPVGTLFDISLQELERLARAAERTAHLPLRAVYTSNVLFGAKIAMQNGDADARSCVTVRSIDLRVKIASRRIRVARELQDKDCLLAAAEKHAAAHARQEERKLRASRAILASSLFRLVQTFPMDGAAKEVEPGLTRAVSTQINADLAKLDEEADGASEAIDSVEALATLKNACPDEQADLDHGRT